MQASFVAKEQVDHALSKSRDAKTKRAVVDKALDEAEKWYKESLFHLAEAEKGCKSAKAALGRAEKQVEELRIQLRKTDEQFTSAQEQVKLQLKELEAKDAEKAKAEQAAYDVRMTKTTQSLAAQLRDIARAFCLEVWGEALNVTRVNANSELRGPSNIYYLPALHVAPSPSPPMFDSTLPSSVPPPSDPFIKKERIEAKQMVELESVEAKVEERPKGKGNGKEKKIDE